MMDQGQGSPAQQGRARQSPARQSPARQSPARQSPARIGQGQGFATLLGIELRRLVRRRSVQLLIALSLVTVVLFGWGAYTDAVPMSQEEIDQATVYYERELADWEENGQEYIAACLEGQAQEAETLGEEVDWGCQDMEPPRLEWFIVPPADLGTSLGFQLGLAMLLVVFTALALGVTAIAAEFTSGSIGTWLTFEPRRTMVLASKTAAVGILSVAFSAIWVTAWLLASWVGFVAAGSEAELTVGVLHWALKLVSASLAAGVIGAALAFVLRHSAAALGVIVGYFVAIDQILLMVVGLEPARISLNISAWVRGEAFYGTHECTTTATGTMCDWVQHSVSMTQGGLVLLGLTLVASAVAWWNFRVRDVN